MLRFIMLNHGSDLPCRKSVRTHFRVSLGWHRSISRRPCRTINLLTKANVPIVLDATRTLCRECGLYTRPEGERPSRIRSGSYPQLTSAPQFLPSTQNYEVPHILYTKVAPTACRTLVTGENRLLQTISHGAGMQATGGFGREGPAPDSCIAANRVLFDDLVGPLQRSRALGAAPRQA